jgi:quinol monooxygenase YgiN
MIHVIATVELVEGKRDVFIETFRKLMPKVHAEKGCIEYGPAMDVDTGLAVQEPVRPDTVVILEKWADIPSLKAHLGQSHMAEYREAVKDLVLNLRLQILQPA